MDHEARKFLLQEFQRYPIGYYNPDHPFTLSSGYESSYYVDCRHVLGLLHIRHCLAKAMMSIMGTQPFDAVGGPESSAIPLAVTIADLSYLKTFRWCSTFMIRKTPKLYGTKQWIDGAVGPHCHPILVDDVLTTGKTLAHAIDVLRSMSIFPHAVLVIVDREECGGRAMIEDMGVPVKCLFTLSELQQHEHVFRTPHVVSS